MRTFFTVLCCLGLVLPMAGAAEAKRANSIEKRLEKVEQKTSHYEIKKSKVIRQWRRNAPAKAPQEVTCEIEDTEEQEIYTCTTDITVGGEHPVFTDAWVGITARYRSNRQSEQVYAVGAARGNRFLQPFFCVSGDSAPASDTLIEYHVQVLCRGVVNAQTGYKVRLSVQIYNTDYSPGHQVTLESVTMDANIINEVLTEFE